jgi:hypothetical protein
MKTYTPQQKAKAAKEYRLALREMLGDLSVDDETDNYYQLTVSKELYEAYGKAEEKCLRYGVNGL